MAHKFDNVSIKNHEVKQKKAVNVIDAGKSSSSSGDTESLSSMSSSLARESDSEEEEENEDLKDL
jgi:hypothetical protein